MTVKQSKPKPDLAEDLQSLIDKIQCIVNSEEYANVENHYYGVCYQLSEALDAANRAIHDIAR